MSHISLRPKHLKRRWRAHRATLRLDQSLQSRDGFKWRRTAPCDLGLFDAGCAQIGKLLYIFGGFSSLNRVSDRVRIFDLERETWLTSLEAPSELPQSHAAVVGDGTRFIYVISGQLGPQCSPAVGAVQCLDTKTKQWHVLPPVPEPRYGGTAQLWNDRLHFVGGAKPDRWTPADDHWSIGVKNGSATEDKWHEHAAIPVPGMHRGSILFDDGFYIFGGQQGDFVAIQGDPDCTCTGETQETYLASCFRLDEPTGAWTQLADLPVPVSHIDFSVTAHDGQLLIFGGQTYKHPTEFYMRLTDAVQSYDPLQDHWTIAGHLPYHLKLPTCGKFNDQFYVVGGQRSAENKDMPGPVTNEVWTSHLNDIVRPLPILAGSSFRNKSIILISHSLSYSGAPLLLLETAQRLIAQGACVRLVSVAKDTAGWTVASKLGIPVIPLEQAIEHAGTADLVIANTVSENVMRWVDDAVNQDPAIAEKLMIWIHEIDVEHFSVTKETIRKAKARVFDSRACRDVWAGELGELPNSFVVHPNLNPTLAGAGHKKTLPFPTNPTTRTDFAQVDRAQARQRLGVNEDEVLVLSLASVEPRKGQRMLLRTLADLAAKENLQVKLALVGFKNWRQRLKFLARMRPQDWQVLSGKRAFVWQTEIAAFYAAADAFVMNTQGLKTNRGECFGRVTIEAMSFGVPACGTDAGGTSEIIETGKTGVLYPLGLDGQSVLADEIKKIVLDRDYAKTLGESGRERVLSDFTQDRFMKEFELAVVTSLKWES